MITQFFGSYLLNNNIITREQLKESIKASKTTRVKLGVLAINAGYMTAEQVEKVNETQKTVGKRIGDLYIKMGFLTPEQLDEVLGSQKPGALALGQAAVDKEFITNAEFEKAINGYKKESELTSLTNSESADVETDLIIKLLDLGDSEEVEMYGKYVSLLFRNMVRFIGDEFIPIGTNEIDSYQHKWMTYQVIKGKKKLFTTLTCDSDTLIKFAGKFAKEEFNKVDDDVIDSVGEFVNLNNGILCVNLSENSGEELELEPQITELDKEITGLKKGYVIPIYTEFGNVNFVVGIVE